ncbi:MAG: hypothetical protein MK085_09100, partial [Phycisphaerales bacterium]|nr:hypothetical protein [Phycisphaerales bacterium]
MFILLTIGVMLAMMAASTLMLFFGVRGRLLLGQPRCRRCDYLVDVDTGEDAICTECGVDINDGDRVRYDRKVRSPGMIVSGVVVFFLSLAVPIAGGILMQLYETPQGIATANAAASSGTVPTWMRPMEETPDKKEHMEWELEGIDNPELLRALAIR